MRRLLAWRNILPLANRFASSLATTLLRTTFARPWKTFERKKTAQRSPLKEVEDAQRFGVAEVCENRVLNIEEKPKLPRSNFAVTGIYLYDSTVFEKIKRLNPSGRGELEITDVKQFLYRRRETQLRNAPRLVDRCRNLRVSSAREQSCLPNWREQIEWPACCSSMKILVNPWSQSSCLRSS
jgi:Nucleotidyl transferase